MFEFEDNLAGNATIKVIGVGGGGGNAVRTMIRSKLDGVEFIAANTDIQALRSHEAMVKIQLGNKLTKGLGAGSNPEVGRDAALEDVRTLQEALAGADLVFITAGLGGGTGTGAAPIIARVAKEVGALTVGVVTMPFAFEGKKRRQKAEQGMEALKNEVDTLITIPNEKLLSVSGKETALLDTFKMADSVLLQAVKGISDLITTPGLINLDFADVKTVMRETGMALMGTGSAHGESRALEAAKMAISSPLLENVSIAGARGILLNITGSSSMTLFEVNEASKLVQEEAHEDANIIFGAVIDDSMKDEIRVTVIATGFNREEKQKTLDTRSHEDRSQQPRIKSWVDYQKARESRSVETRTPEVRGVETRGVETRGVDIYGTEPRSLEVNQIENFRTDIQMEGRIPENRGLETRGVETRGAESRTFVTRSVDTQKIEPTSGNIRQTSDRFESASLFPSKNTSSKSTSSFSLESETPLFTDRPSITREPVLREGFFQARGDMQLTESAPNPPLKRREFNRVGGDELKKIVAEIGITDVGDEEYDIPAFIRRRAD